jgi:hypothetical protein
MKSLLAIFTATAALLLPASGADASAVVSSNSSAATQPSPAATTEPAYIKMAESAPVRIGDWEFVVATPEVWSLRAGLSGSSPDIQLFITNKGSHDVLFPTFDTFGIILTAPDGTKVGVTGGRDGTRETKPILLPPGGRYCLVRTSKVYSDRNLGSTTFTYEDGTGSIAIYGPMSAGTYGLKFWLRGAPPPFQPPGQTLPDNVPIWLGEGSTNEVRFQILMIK